MVTDSLTAEGPEETEVLNVCSECIEEQFLKREVETQGVDGTCSYCTGGGNTLSIDRLADRVEIVLDEFFHQTEEPGGGSKPLAEVIGDLAALVMPQIAEDVRGVMKVRHGGVGATKTAFWERPFDPDALYRKKETVHAWELEGKWIDFTTSLSRENRYFNRAGEELLRRLFEGIDGLTTFRRHKAVIEAGPDTEYAKLYRARVFEDDAEFDKAVRQPARELGPPPPPKATSGRMNAAGVPVFYGANDPEVALAEVRPAVGSKVAIGTFEVLRPLRLLNLIALEDLLDEAGSLFDPEHVARLKRAAFLRGLSSRLSKPVLPNDELLSFLPTQAVADFLANSLETPLDGLIYPSVQVGPLQRGRRLLFGGPDHRRNVVLFPRAAKVRPMREGVLVDIAGEAGWRLLSRSLLGDNPRATIDDDPGVEYKVRESEAPPDDPELDEAPLQLSSLEVRTVTAVEFKSPASTVHRQATSEGEPDDGR